MSVKAILSASVSAGPAVYVEDVFSTFLYTGNGSTQTITNGIALANGFSITPGTALSGGFFAGYISHTANSVATHALIVAPSATGYNGQVPMQWKTTNTTTAGTTSSFDGAANSANMNDANHPAAQYCEGLSIGGYTDWYLPARYELEIAYYNLKPTTEGNNTSYGINSYSVPARASNYTSGNPAQTTVVAFQVGGAEDFRDSANWSSTENNATSAFVLMFQDGRQLNYGKTDGTAYVRAFRKIPINDPLITAYAVTGEGGLVWTKGRNTNWHYLIDNERGTGKILYSNLTDAQENFLAGSLTYSSTGYALSGTAFGSNGDINSNGVNYCSWTFRKAPKFFDVVTYTGNGAGQGVRAIAHGLTSTPGCIIIKRLDSSSEWAVWHRYAGVTNQDLSGISLNGTGAAIGYPNGTTALMNSASFDPANIYGVNAIACNINNATYVAYLFAHDAGGFGDAGTDNVVSCGSYTTDGSGNFTDQNIGYEPQWLMLKSSNTTDPWIILDSMRGLNLTQYVQLFANTSGAENAGNSAYVYPTSTGFGGSNSNLDASATYIYIAIRRGPMKTPESGTEVFAPTPITATQATQNITSVGFSPDMIINGVRSDANYGQQVTDRLRGVNKQLFTEYTSAEATTNGTALVSLNMNGFTLGSDSAGSGWNAYSGFTSIKWSFRRAPGFFDVVAYTGNDVNRTIGHNLAVAPELMIVKRRDGAASDWQVYAGAADKYLVLNTTAAYVTADTRWNNTAPTSTVFTVGTSSGVNGSGITYIAYLFATLTGVSKVGSYTGTGALQTINCGFTTGARFVLIKRTDSTGDWFVWDTARGIISGNDPYLLLNSAAAEVTNTDYIDPLSTGFQISSTAPAAINASGGTYIFLAIS